MKKRALVILLCLCLCMTLCFFVACGDDEDTTPCTEHTDANNDGICDRCGAKIEKPGTPDNPDNPDKTVTTPVTGITVSTDDEDGEILEIIARKCMRGGDAGGDDRKRQEKGVPAKIPGM